jgi:transcriptional regulator of heat shock response
MAKILVNLDNVHRDEIEQLKESLDSESWGFEELNKDEVKGVISMINYIIDKRINDRASSLSYTELINLKNKLAK